MYFMSDELVGGHNNECRLRWSIFPQSCLDHHKHLSGSHDEHTLPWPRFFRRVWDADKRSRRRMQLKNNDSGNHR